MADLFDSWTNLARTVLTEAGERAEKVRDMTIDPTHILFGLLQVPEGVAFKVLQNLGVNRAQVLNRLASSGNDSNLTMGALSPSLTEVTRRLVDGASEEARELKHGYVGTEHLLLALLRDQGEAERVLREQGVTYERARDEIERLLRRR